MPLDDNPAGPSEATIHGVTAPIFFAIGHVAHHWSRLEYEINRTIWAFSRLSPHDGACITSQIASVIPRMRALIALADKYECPRTTLKDLNRFSADADKLSKVTQPNNP